MFKRIVATMLVSVMMLSVLSGCGNNVSKTESSAQESSQVSQKAEEETGNSETKDGEIAVDAFAGTELTIAIMRDPADQCEDFNDKPGIKMAEEATGIHINWVDLEYGTHTDRVNVMLASDEKDLPDAFIGLVKENMIAQNLDLFYDLTQEDVLSTYAPNIVADYEANVDGGLQFLTWGDGSIRTLPTALQTNYAGEGAGIVVLNKAWLDKLGKEVPTTAEAFYDVLCAFRDNDMNGNGDATDEIPLSFANGYWAGHFMHLANPWGIAGTGTGSASHYVMAKDGKAVPTANTDEFRAFIEYHNKLAKEGLLDIEGFSQTSEQYGAKVKEGLVGAFVCWTKTGWLTNEEAQNYVVLKPFKAIDGVEPVKTGAQNIVQANRTGLAVTAKCTNVEALLHWWNYLGSSTEMKYTVAYGEKGNSWDIDADGNVVDLTPPGVTETFTANNYDYTNGLCGFTPMICTNELPLMDRSNLADVNTERLVMVDEIWDMQNKEYMPIKFVAPEKTNERTLIENELVLFIDNFVATSVVDGITDDSWKSYLSQLDALMYDEWIQWYQDLLDGKM